MTVYEAALFFGGGPIQGPAAAGSYATKEPWASYDGVTWWRTPGTTLGSNQENWTRLTRDPISSTNYVGPMLAFQHHMTEVLGRENIRCIALPYLASDLLNGVATWQVGGAFAESIDATTKLAIRTAHDEGDDVRVKWIIATLGWNDLYLVAGKGFGSDIDYRLWTPTLGSKLRPLVQWLRSRAWAQEAEIILVMPSRWHDLGPNVAASGDACNVIRDAIIREAREHERVWAFDSTGCSIAITGTRIQLDDEGLVDLGTSLAEFVVRPKAKPTRGFLLASASDAHFYSAASYAADHAAILGGVEPIEDDERDAFVSFGGGRHRRRLMINVDDAIESTMFSTVLPVSEENHGTLEPTTVDPSGMPFDWRADSPSIFPFPFEEPTQALAMVPGLRAQWSSTALARAVKPFHSRRDIAARECVGMLDTTGNRYHLVSSGLAGLPVAEYAEGSGLPLVEIGTLAGALNMAGHTIDTRGEGALFLVGKVIDPATPRVLIELNGLGATNGNVRISTDGANLVAEACVSAAWDARSAMMLDGTLNAWIIAWRLFEGVRRVQIWRWGTPAHLIAGETQPAAAAPYVINASYVIVFTAGSMYLGEAARFDRWLNVYERQRLMNYAHARWGLGRYP